MILFNKILYLLFAYEFVFKFLNTFILKYLRIFWTKEKRFFGPCKLIKIACKAFKNWKIGFFGPKCKTI